VSSERIRHVVWDWNGTILDDNDAVIVRSTIDLARNLGLVLSLLLRLRLSVGLGLRLSLGIGYGRSFGSGLRLRLSVSRVGGGRLSGRIRAGSRGRLIGFIGGVRVRSFLSLLFFGGCLRSGLCVGGTGQVVVRPGVVRGRLGGGRHGCGRHGCGRHRDVRGPDCRRVGRRGWFFCGFRQERQRLREHARRGRRRWPDGRVAAQQRRDHRGEPARMRGNGRVLVDDRGHRGDGAAAVLVRPASLYRRVDRRAERPQVGRGRGVAAPDALGRGEPGRAHHHPGLRQPRVALELRDTEVGQYGPLVPAFPGLVGRDEHVARLHVPVQHTRRVRGGERGEHLLADPAGPSGREPPLYDEHLVERLRRDEFHHDPGTTVFLRDVVNGYDATVGEPRGSSRLAQRPLVGVAALVRADQGRDDDLLDRDITVKELVASTPHHAHGASADRVLQVVPPGDDPSCHRGHSRTIPAFRGGCRLRAADPLLLRRNRCLCRRR